MECSTVKGLLSEYLDGMLDEKTSAAVQAHLSECSKCRKEHGSLEALLHELGDMASVRPPADFLVRLHERLDRPSWFARIIRALFVPMRFKFPLEFAAVALVAVIIFSIINVTPDVHMASRSPEQSLVGETGGEAGVREASRSARQETPEPEAPVRARVAEVLEEDRRKPLEMVLFLREKGPTRLMAKAARAPMPGGGWHKGKTDSDLHADPEAGRYAAQSHRAAGSKAPVEDKAPTPYPADVMVKVRDVITALGGQIVYPDEARQGGDPMALTARLPAAQYTSLVEKLNALGTLQSPVPMPPETYQGTIQLRVKILPE
jgi:hypothetical protein